jgi:hypothetical protein
MTKDEALRLALEALEEITRRNQSDHQAEIAEEAITAIKSALKAKDEPVAWPCLIANADFDKETVTLVMQCSDYKVSAGMHWLLTTPPQRTWVGLTPEDTFEIGERLGLSDIAWVDLMQAIEDKLKQKNT